MGAGDTAYTTMAVQARRRRRTMRQRQIRLAVPCSSAAVLAIEAPYRFSYATDGRRREGLMRAVYADDAQRQPGMTVGMAN